MFHLILDQFIHGYNNYTFNFSSILLCKMLSINQLQAQIKLMEMWKSKHNDNYSLKIDTLKQTEIGITTKGVTNDNFKHINTPTHLHWE